VASERRIADATLARSTRVIDPRAPTSAPDAAHPHDHPHAHATSDHACSLDHRLQCMEVWGGNRATDTRVELTGLDAWVYSKPYQGQAEGGDIHYLSSCASGRVSRLLVADVSGHGTKVASIAVGLRNLMRRNVNFADTRRVAAGLNREFADVSREGGFATAIVASYWGPSGTLSLCNAGHPRPVWWSGRRGTWGFLDTRSSIGDAGSRSIGTTNVPLGIADGVTYDQTSVRLGSDDVVLVYTDSLMEAPGPDGRTLGELGVLGLVEQAWESTREAGPEALLRGVLERVRGLGEATRDDVTLVALRPNARTMDPGVLGAARVALRVVKGVFGVHPASD
jgi:phosphoserine phosphatase RsbU/P